MSNTTISYATPAEAIRVFCGFPTQQLSEEAFFAQLGQTFMPGTPYMLQPLGLAAYLPGVLSAPPPGLPHEFALICYPSRAAWDHAMNQTLRGRVYNLTHGGTYSMSLSGAAFPILIDELPMLATDPFFLFPAAIDWQEGFTHVAVGPKKVAVSSDAFRGAFRQALLAQRDSLRKKGVDQLVAAVHDAFAIVWLHSVQSTINGAIDFFGDILDNVIVLSNERVLCVDEPPTISIKTSRAFNFIFLRENKYFQS